MDEKKKNEVFFQSENLAVPEVIVEEEAETEDAEDAAAAKNREQSEDDEPRIVFDTLAVPEVDFSDAADD